MKSHLKQSLSFSAAVLLGMSVSIGSFAQTLSQSPLEASVFAKPNIMLNLDDSGSMQNLTTEAAFISDIAYPEWEFTISQRARDNGGFPTNIPIPEISGPGCPANNPVSQTNEFRWISASLNGGTARCMKVPAPTDNGALIGVNGWRNFAYYSREYLRYLFANYSEAGVNVDLTVAGTNPDGSVRPPIPTDTRLQALQEAAKALVGSRNGIRWCASELDHTGSDGNGFMLETCQDPTPAHIANIRAEIDGLPYGGGTPVAESFYKVFRYFQTGYDGGNVSPVQFRCQQNYAVVITDGLPNGDFASDAERATVSGITRSTYGLSGTGSLPNWDNTATATTVAQVRANQIPAGSDGFPGDSSEGATLYLDDFALFANEVDMFRTGNDAAGQPWDDAVADAALPPGQRNPFAHQNVETYIIGMGIQNTMLDEAGANGNGRTFSVGNRTELALALNEITNGVTNRVGSSASSSATASFLASGNQLFQVKYDTSDWSGSLNSFEIESDPSAADFGEIKTPALWSTDTSLVYTPGTPPARNAMILNTDTNNPQELTWANLSDTQQAQFREDQTLLDYVLGDQSLEATNGGTKRSRSKLLGDVVHSQPVYVKDLDYGYSDADYQTFLQSNTVTNRIPMVYVGGNDGMMHGFNAGTGSTAGREELAFMPRSAPSYMKEYDVENYSHRYFVDGKNVAIDAKLTKNGSEDWGTILLSSMGAGARGMFALDITNPNDFSSISTSASDVYLWEISNTLPAESSGALVDNVALNGTATQSSVDFSGNPGRAIDGSANGVYGNNSVTHTTFDDEAWWEVELDATYAISDIVINNRTDCCSDRLSDFSVFVSEEPFVTTGYEDTKSQPGVTEFYFPGAAGSQINIDTDEISGRYVRVQLSGENFLSLAEVQVNAISNPAYPDMGHIIDRSSVVRVGDASNNAWYALTGNGVHSDSGNAVFYAIDLSTGEKVQELVLDNTGNNGIVSNTAVDLDGDSFVDRVYLSDIKGNVWRLDANTSTLLFESEYTDSGDATPMFTATETGTGATQPITVAPEVLRVPGVAGALMVYFGTGKYYDVEDAELAATVAAEPTRSFYGVIDRGQGGQTNWTTLIKSNLTPQSVSTGTISGNDVRALTNDPVDFNTVSGWYFDLPGDGERVVFEPVAIRDRILLSTIIPAQRGTPDPCVPNVTGWLMEVGAFDGGSPDSTVFDANGDNNFDSSDVVTISGSSREVAGIQPSAGAPLPPALIRVEPGPGSGQNASIQGTGVDSAGNLYKLTHEAPIVRTSWRRLD
ncbi:MAG: discoidin domain-containing protein [Acidiferrobacterales bacterium]|nr:discoidin domain-containing protein [Acidiferrobacterales bacterium]